MHINVRGKLIGTEGPVVMGILNLTPDSFYDGGSNSDPAELLRKAGRMLDDGALMLDLGAVSTRPGSEGLNAEQEWERLAPALKAVRSAFPEAILSIDTYRSLVAERAADEGADLINDISAGQLDPDMLRIIGRRGIPYVMMHMQGTPATMQEAPAYENVVREVLQYFAERIDQATRAGVHDIILDPGFGFGKSTEHNYRLLASLDLFNIFNRPLLIGVSRKSMINKILGTTPREALNGTTAVHTLALSKGANILRVHDVKEAVEAIRIYQALSI